MFTTGDNNGKESKEPDHDEYKDQAGRKAGRENRRT